MAAVRPLTLRLDPPIAYGEFSAMASPCQVLLDTDDWLQAAQALQLVASECWRIEQKYSRYQADSVIGQLHVRRGQPQTVDAETARLLDFAQTLYELSDGAFDITSGLLRHVWRFDGSDRLPSREAVTALLPLIGWDRVLWQSPQLTLPKGVELDLGGIGKEYAVDQCFDRLVLQFDGAFLLNFGGDLRTRGPRRDQKPWQIGLEQPDQFGAALAHFDLTTGALATSGDARRFLMRDGVRYGHILDPRTGWPIQGAPRSVTVFADTCTEAGMLATLAMLQGAGAREFLNENAGGHSWIVD